jgi:hypothetical protein
MVSQLTGNPKELRNEIIGKWEKYVLPHLLTKITEHEAQNQIETVKDVLRPDVVSTVSAVSL